MLLKLAVCAVAVLCIITGFQCSSQTGPDPWNYEENELSNNVDDDKGIPPDLRIYPTKKTQSETTYGIGEWFYRRMLTIVLKGGQVENNEDGSVQISLQMKLDQHKWTTLDEYLKSSTALSEDELRRSLGYIEQSIYKPSVTTVIILTWSEYIQTLLREYKTEITWSLVLSAIFSLLYWICRHMSNTNAKIIIFLSLYAYEVFVSYKEAEQKEVEMFVTAINSCKWYIWSSKCELPKPDPLVFLKHMNPIKIGARMFTSVISEPMIVLTETVKVMAHGITDGLWYPLDVIVYSILVTFIIILMIFFLIMIVFNFILNIPFNFSIFGLVNIVMRQRNRTLFTDVNNQNQNNSPRVEVFTDVNNQNQNNSSRVEIPNTLSGPTLDKFLDVFSKVLNTDTKPQTQQRIHDCSNRASRQLESSTKNTEIKRSASTGRLPSLNSFGSFAQAQNVTKRNVTRHIIDGRGDML